MLTRNHRQEALSRAYVQIIAAQAGMTYSVASNDYGIDLTLNDIELRGRRRLQTGFRLDVQAKSTTLAHVKGAAVRYNMEVRAYEDLREPLGGCPRILLVLVLPAQESDWCSQSPDQLILRRCAYWLSLRGLGPTTNRKTVQVAIPTTQVFSTQALRDLINRIKSGGEP